MMIELRGYTVKDLIRSIKALHGVTESDKLTILIYTDEEYERKNKATKRLSCEDKN